MVNNGVCCVGLLAAAEADARAGRSFVSDQHAGAANARGGSRWQPSCAMAGHAGSPWQHAVFPARTRLCWSCQTSLKLQSVSLCSKRCHNVYS